MKADHIRSSVQRPLRGGKYPILARVYQIPKPCLTPLAENRSREGNPARLVLFRGASISLPIPKIADITGSFGHQPQNGVARFHADLHQWSQEQRLPLTVFSAGKHVTRDPGVRNIHAVSFAVPDYPAEESGVVVTHGHISEVPELAAILKTAESPQEIICALAVPRLRDRLKQTAVEYDLSGVFTNFLEDAGLDGVEDLWRHILPQRQRFVELPVSALRSRGLETQLVSSLVHMLGHRDRERALAELGVSVQQAIQPRTRATRPILLGNSGSFRRKSVPPIWLEAQYPHLELWAYDPNRRDAVIVDRVTWPN